MRWWQIRRRDADLERELRSDLELEEEEQREKGLSEDEARYAARRAFGNTTLIRQQTHEVWGWDAVRALLAGSALCRASACEESGILRHGDSCAGAGHRNECGDLRFCGRGSYRPLPYADPQRLVHVTESDPTSPHVNISYLDYLDWKKQNTTLASMDVFTGWNMLLSRRRALSRSRGEVERGIFSNAGRGSVAGPGFSSRRRYLGRAGCGDAKLRHLAETVRRQERCGRAITQIQRRFSHGNRCAARRF